MSPTRGSPVSNLRATDLSGMSQSSSASIASSVARISSMCESYLTRNVLLGLNLIAALRRSSTPSSLTATVGTMGIRSIDSSFSTSIVSPVFFARSCMFKAATTLYPDSMSSNSITRFLSSLVASMTSMTTSGFWSYRRSVATLSSSVFPASE